MASLTFSEDAIEDLARLAEFLRKDDPAAAATGALIREGLAILEAHPLIGAPIAGGWRRLVISRGHTGYIALYEYQSAFDRVVVHAIRHQREAGFKE